MNFQEIRNELLTSMQIFLDKTISKLNFDYTFSAIIKTDNGNGNYTITYNEQDYDVNARDGLTLVVDDIVYVRVVRGDFSQKFIDCKRV